MLGLSTLRDPVESQRWDEDVGAGFRRDEAAAALE